jgi:hypothetical protein
MHSAKDGRERNLGQQSVCWKSNEHKGRNTEDILSIS